MYLLATHGRFNLTWRFYSLAELLGTLSLLRPKSLHVKLFLMLLSFFLLVLPAIVPFFLPLGTSEIVTCAQGSLGLKSQPEWFLMEIPCLLESES